MIYLTIQGVVERDGQLMPYTLFHGPLPLKFTGNRRRYTYTFPLPTHIAVKRFQLRAVKGKDKS